MPSRILCLLSALLLSFSAAVANAQAYTTIVVFGDSLSDVGNVAHLTEAKYTITTRIPGPVADYTDGRFTDGPDTLPPANNYNGVWIEQLAAMLPGHPVIKNSLDGGNDYAYGGATTGASTTAFTFGPGNALSVTIDNIGQQIQDYLATHPTIDSHTLFVVWGGADDILQATSSADISQAVSAELSNIQTLIAAGATDFLIPNLPPLGAVPRLNGSPLTSTPATQASAAFNQGLTSGIGYFALAAPGRTLHFFQLDVFSLFNNVIASPSTYLLANVTDSSQAEPVNPDTYLFWDDLHPTTRGHNILAVAAQSSLTTTVATTTTVASSALNSNFNSSVTFTATVVAASGSPGGTVSFVDGANVIGSGTLNSTGSATGTATFSTSSLTVGTHPITAIYSGAAGYMTSASATITQTVTAPALVATFSPTSITVARGSTGTSTLTVTPTGGYSGTVTLACGTLPAHVSCTFAPASINLDGSNTVQTSTLTIGTTAVASAALLAPNLPFSPGTPLIFSAFALFPFVGFGGLAAFRRRRPSHQSVRLLVLVTILSVGAVLGLAGCGGADNNAVRGTYTVPVNITANGSTSTQNLTIIVQ